MSKEIIQAAVESLNKFANEQFIRVFGEDHPSSLVYEISVGRVYTKIIKRDFWKSTQEICNGSVYCFIKNDDLTIWKAASWAAPAKNKPRGHVSDFHDESKYLKGKIEWTGF